MVRAWYLSTELGGRGITTLLGVFKSRRGQVEIAKAQVRALKTQQGVQRVSDILEVLKASG